jgi:pimeloyl-ACP methyl ester carboxylesterase
MRVAFVHGACVRDGSWWWHRTGDLLKAQGVESVTPPLPSCGETGELPGTDGPGLPDDVLAVEQCLKESEEPTIIVAHSYGGIVAAEAASGISSVRHLVFVSSYLPEIGDSLSSFSNGAPAPFLDIDAEGGTFGVQPDLLAATFLQDCDAEVRTQAADHLARQSLQVTQQSVQAAAWHQVPSTYVVCAQDKGTSIERQRSFSRRAGTVVELAAGHHPFLSQPAAFRDLLLTL